MNSPEGLLQLWSNFNTWIRELKGEEEEADGDLWMELSDLDDDLRYEYCQTASSESFDDPWDDIRCEIRRRWSIKDLLDQLGAVPMGGGTYLCPFHEETRPSFSLYLNNRGGFVWVDFHGDAPVGFRTASGYSMGDAIDLYQYLHDLPSPGAATAAMAKELGIELRTPEYEHTSVGTVWNKPVKNGVVPILLSNFNAMIEEEVIVDDGAEERRYWRINGDVAGRDLAMAEIPVDLYPGMSWVTRHWGSRAVVRAGQGTKDHLRVATQVLSPEPPVHRVYAHTGWKRIDDMWVFLHADGGIDESGLRSDVQVKLTGTLESIQLPPPPEGRELVDAVRSFLELENLAPPEITHALICAVIRAVLCEVDPALFSVFLVGRTGAGKTSLIAVFQAAYGASFKLDHLPAGWASTPNALERIAFLAKDVMAVFDDFAPNGTQADVRKMHSTAERILRGAGNKSGRGRLRPDATARPTYYPRGLVVSTGEDVPDGHSLRARTLLIEVGPGDVNFDDLGEAQDSAGKGVYASAMAGFIKWLASRLDHLHHTSGVSMDRSRKLFRTSGGHRRTPEMVASLFLAFEVFMEFAADIGALSAGAAAKLLDRVQRSLKRSAAAQAEHHRSADPVDRFLELLASAIDSGSAHVAAPDGSAPDGARIWGWTVWKKNSMSTTYQPSGELVGWIDDEDLYLNKDAAYKVVQKLARSQGTSIGLSSVTLAKRMAERRILASHNKDRTTVRKSLAGVNRRVLHLHADRLKD